MLLFVAAAMKINIKIYSQNFLRSSTVFSSADSNLASECFSARDLYTWFKDHIKELTVEQIAELASLIKIEQSKSHTEADSNIEETGNLICVCCGSNHIKKHGKSNGKQRYICKDCGKTFNRLTGMIMNRSRLTSDQWKELPKKNGYTLSRLKRTDTPKALSIWAESMHYITFCYNRVLARETRTNPFH